MLKNTADSYGTFSRVMHWAMAIVIVGLVIVGIYMSDLAREDPLRRELIGLHKNFGVLAMLLVILRLAWLRSSPAPALPAVFTNKEARLVSVIKSTLYILMILMPVSGYLMSISGGHAVSVFGLFELPNIIAKNEGVHELTEGMHALLGNLLIVAVLLHIAGVIKHRLKDKNGASDILKRMI